MKYLNIKSMVILMVGLGIACHQQKEEIVREENVVTISMDSIYREKEILIKEITPLETNDSSVIGFSWKIIKHDKKYFILDYDEWDIKVFDDAGHFLYTFGNQGRGPHEYISLEDINFNPHTNTIDFLDPRGKLLSYDLEMHQYEPDIIIPADVPQISNFHWLDPEIMVTSSSAQDILLRFYDRKQDKIIKQELSSSKIRTGGGGSFAQYPFWVFGGEVNYLDEHTLSLYRIRDLQIERRLRFDFGRHHFDYEEIKDIGMQIENLGDYLVKEEKAFPVLNCFENKEYLGIGIRFHRGIHYFLIDKKTEEIFVLPMGSYDQNFMDYSGFASGLNVGEFRALIRNPVMFDEIFLDADIPDEWRSMIEAASDIDNPWIVHYEVR